MLVVAGAIACLWLTSPDPAWLAAHDALEPAPVIAALNGETCARAEKAAALYAARYGREIWLTDDPAGGAEQDAGTRANRRCLTEVHRIPADAIHVVPERISPHWASKTFAEIGIIQRELARRGIDRVVLVTSRLQGARTRVIWDLRAGASPIAVSQHPAEDTNVGGENFVKELGKAAPLWIPWILTRSPLEHLGRARVGVAGPREQQRCRC